MNKLYRAMALLSAQEAVLILDGGFGSELVQAGHDLSSPLWSAAILQQDPQAISDLHLAYLEAGAQCIISASYQLSLPGAAALGISAQETRELLLASVQLAKSACAAFVASHSELNFDPLIAASIGPYGAYLADGSEYCGDYAVNDETLRQFHRQRLEWLDQSGADILACETIPSLQEAEVLAALLETARTPAWVSFACKNHHQLNDGHSLQQAAALFADHPTVFAIGVNCTSPNYIETLVAEIKQGAGDKAIVVYPNSGESYNAGNKTWSGTVTPLECATAAKRWRLAGARLIGGCCRMGPDHIREIAAALNPVG